MWCVFKRREKEEIVINGFPQIRNFPLSQLCRRLTAFDALSIIGIRMHCRNLWKTSKYAIVCFSSFSDCLQTYVHYIMRLLRKLANDNHNVNIVFIFCLNSVYGICNHSVGTVLCVFLLYENLNLCITFPDRNRADRCRAM